jgi:hypothetical protein
MSLASWKVRTTLAVALALAWAYVPAYGQDVSGGTPPVITSITAVQVAGQKFRIYGTVADDTPGSCSVKLTGAADGTTQCDASGNFDGVFNVTTPGNATAVANDGQLDSQPVSLNLGNNAPTTTCKAVLGPGNLLTISGRVTDEAPGGLTVILSGSRAVAGLSAIVLANGDWSVSTTVPPGSHGSVTATVTDWFGLTGTRTANY